MFGQGFDSPHLHLSIPKPLFSRWLFYCNATLKSKNVKISFFRPIFGYRLTLSCMTISKCIISESNYPAFIFVDLLSGSFRKRQLFRLITKNIMIKPVPVVPYSSEPLLGFCDPMTETFVDDQLCGNAIIQQPPV
jgi:hypothetical protein